ncbi:hypothetical protein LCGC14_1565430, partial [marine sediment metagenome]
LTMGIPIAMGANPITGVSNIDMTSASSILNDYKVGAGGGNERLWIIVVYTYQKNSAEIHVECYLQHSKSDSAAHYHEVVYV